MSLDCARGVALWFVTTALVPAAVAAQPATSDRAALEAARDHMEQGQQLYVQQHYLEAAEEFLQAYEARPFAAFLYNAGVSMENAGALRRAAQYFERYLQADPNAEDADETRERIERLRAEAVGSEPTPPCEGENCPQPCEGENCPQPCEGENCPQPCEGENCPQPCEGENCQGTTTDVGGRVQTPPQPQQMKSLLSIDTDPEGATVTLKQGSTVVAQGPAPFVQTLEEGEYRLIVEHPDFRRAEERVRIRPGNVYVVILNLSQGEFTGYVRVVTNPPGAQVYFDNRDEGAVGTSPFSNVISTGTHHVWVERPGFGVEQEDFEVNVGEHVTVHLDLTRVDHGRLRVVANMRGAVVHVDGREIGQVPLEADVASGTRRVRVSFDGMKDWEGNVTIRNGQLTPVRVRLRPAVSRGGAWATAGLGVAFIGGGIALGVISGGIESNLRSDRNAGILASDDSRITTGRFLSIGADVAFGLGVLMGALSVYYFLRDPLPDSEGQALEPRDWALVPQLGPSYGGADFMWRF